MSSTTTGRRAAAGGETSTALRPVGAPAALSQTEQSPERPAAPAAAAASSAMQPGRARQLLTAALLLAMSVVALETTVVTTALPSVVGELQGLTLYPWIFSVYLLASTTTVPIYGKLADVYGRKPVFLFGLSLFLVGTALCGAAQSMVQLVALRAVQGLGAGAVLPMTLTVMGDIYTLRERAKVQPLTAAVWGILSLVGPAAGALITETLSWRWVFWVAIPVGVLAMAMLVTFLKERVARREVSIDYAGAATLTLGVVTLLLAALEGGRAFAWGSWQILALLGSAGAFFVLFALAEQRAQDPVVPVSAFRLREVAVSNLGNVLFGACQFGLTSYVPLWVQGVRGESAAGAGAVLTPQFFGWSLVALLSGRLYVRFGWRRTALVGVVCIALGIAPLVFVTAQTPLWLIMAASGLCGIGFGNASTAFLLAPQSAVPWNVRGSVTSSTQFARNIGGAIAVALLGASLSAHLTPAARAYASSGRAGDVESVVSALLTPESRAHLPADAVVALSGAMAEGLHRVFIALLALAVVGVVQVALFARDRATPAAAAPRGAPGAASAAGSGAAAAIPADASPSPH